MHASVVVRSFVMSSMLGFVFLFCCFFMSSVHLVVGHVVVGVFVGLAIVFVDVVVEVVVF